MRANSNDPRECDSCCNSLVSFSHTHDKIQEGICPFCSDPHTVEEDE